MDVCCTDSSEKGENQPLIAKMNRSICTNNGKSWEYPKVCVNLQTDVR